MGMNNRQTISSKFEQNSASQVFSIITPTFNQLEWLQLCIASVRDQAVATPSAFRVEHIIQDGGTPGVEELARELGTAFYRDGKLVFSERKEARDQGRETSQQHPKPANEDQSHYSLRIFSEKDAGMYDAINRGLARSTGEICAWLNSDEQYLPETLSKVTKIFQQQTKLDILLGDAILLNSSLEPVCYRRIMVPSLWHTRLVHLHSLSCAMFFKKSALPNPPLNPRWKVISDAVLMEHFLLSRKTIHACMLPLAVYAFTGQNLSADKNCNELEQWWAETRRPPRLLKPLVVIHNRFRRLLAGAYRSFPVDTKIHTFSGYKSLKISLSCLWPAH
jgi:glycosyltransferase involved in cell wall biosynthesis